MHTHIYEGLEKELQRTNLEREKKRNTKNTC